MTAWRKIMNALGVGSTTADSRESGGMQALQVRIFGALSATKDPAPSLQQFGFASRPHIGCRVAVINLGGDPTKSVIVATDDARYRPADLAPGEAKLYSSAGAFVHVDAAGNITLKPKAGGYVTVDGELRVTGEVTGKYGSGGSITLTGHDHAQGPDSAGNTQASTEPPTAGT